MFLTNKESLSVALLSCTYMVCAFVSVVCESNDGKCISLWNSPMDICTKAGYNYTLPLPEQFNEHLQREFGHLVTMIITKWHNCTTQSLAAIMECSFTFPKCSVKGERVYPCKRVCGEFLKQCMNSSDGYRDIYMDLILSFCLILPDEQPNGDNCFEPPNFTTDHSVKSPLDRGCQKLIIPVCKQLGIYSHTLFSESTQKKLYRLFYNKTYDERDLEQGFPKRTERILTKYTRCRKNIEKLFCGEHFPPCFPEENKHVMKTLCRSVCDDIVKDCPGFFSDHFVESEYCGLLADGQTSHGFCDQKEWPSPFTFFLNDVDLPTTLPTEKPKRKGPKVWAITVAVVVTLLVVGLALVGLIWWKWRGQASGMGYKRQQDDPVT